MIRNIVFYSIEATMLRAVILLHPSCLLQAMKKGNECYLCNNIFPPGICNNVIYICTIKKRRYKSCEPLTLTCPSCSASFNCPSITSSVCASISNKSETEESTFWLRLHCSKCTGRISPAMIANQVGNDFS